MSRSHISCDKARLQPCKTLMHCNKYALRGIVQHMHQLRCESCRRHLHTQVTFRSQTVDACQLWQTQQRLAKHLSFKEHHSSHCTHTAVFNAPCNHQYCHSRTKIRCQPFHVTPSWSQISAGINQHTQTQRGRETNFTCFSQPTRFITRAT